MTPQLQIRSIATALLRAAAKIAPPQATEWAYAMVAELHHIEGDWSALAWSIGSAGVLAKHAIFDFFVPNHALSEAPFFAKEKPMRKSTAIAAAVCIAASLLFFAAPTFREALQLSVIQWRGLMRAAFQTGYVSFDSGFDYERLAQQAETNHDAEGLAYAALHERYSLDGAKLADKAVSMDPQFTWIYAIVANGLVPQPQVKDWIAKLEQFDPQNAIPHLIQAQLAVTNVYADHKYIPNRHLNDSAWLDAMSVVFASRKIDTYGSRARALDTRVALRYNLYDPYQTNDEYFLIAGAVPTMGSPSDYVKVLLDSGDALAAHGDYQGAEKQYRLAAHFGEMVQVTSREGYGAFRGAVLADQLLKGPYGRLSAYYERRGETDNAKHFATLMANADREREGQLDTIRFYFDSERPTEGRNAKIVGLAGITLFLSAATFLLCAIVILAKSGSIQLSKLDTSLLTRALARCSVLGLLLSPLALYLGYRPYAKIVRAYLLGGDASQMPILNAFMRDLDYSRNPPQHQALYSLWSFPMYFWAGIIVVCAIALLFVTAKFLWQKRSALPA